MLGLNPPKSGRTFATVAEAFGPGTFSSYWGENQDWLVVAARNRDSDALEESNFRVLHTRLKNCPAQIERAGHFLCGWVEYLIIPPENRAALRIALTARRQLEDYSVLSDTDFSELEYERFHDWAESELRKYDNWAQFLEEALQESNSGPGDETAESRIVEAARAKCEAYAELVEARASSPIDPGQE